MAVSYEEALATLQSMFSDQGYTTQHLDAVLRHHGGHMEDTVETLLSHGEGTPDELMTKLPSIPTGGAAAPPTGGDAAHDVDADEELARQLAAEDERVARARTRGVGHSSAMGSNRGIWNNRSPPAQRRPMASTVAAPARPPAAAARPKPPAGTKGRGTPTRLPPDFLRIPGRKYPVANTPTSNNVSAPIASASGPGGMGQMMTDEQLARMLQDELFQEELRNNPEFSHLAGRRNIRATSGGVGGQATGRSTYSGAGGGAGGPDIFDRMSELGDNAKRRFQQFAANWNDPNRSTQQSRPLFGGGGQNVPNAGTERRGLLSNDLNMDEEEEMDFVGSGAGSGRAFEMNDVGGSADKKKD